MFLFLALYLFWGVRKCFPGRGSGALRSLFLICPRFCFRAPHHQGPPGRLDVFSQPRSSTWRSSLFSISTLSLIASSRIACSCSLITLVLGFSILKFSSGVVSRSTGVERLVVCFIFQLSWSFCADTMAGCLRMSKSSDSRRHEDWLSLMFRVPVNRHTQVTQCMV